MADPEVRIKVTANTTQAQSALSGLNKSWIGVNSALDLGKKAAQFLGDAYNALVGDTQEYAQAVLKMTRVSGQSAEMTSRLIELTDDFGIAQETLSVAMRTATRNGIEFSVNKLAALSDQYLSLPEGIARAQMAAETFGSRAGPEMQKLLEKGSDAIRDQAAAIDEHMLMTEEDLEASEQLRIAQDNLSDSVTALGRTIGKELIPPLATAADAANMLLTNEGKLDDAFDEHKQTVISTAATYEEYMNEMLRAAVVAGKIPQSVYDTWKDTPEILEESALELGFLSRRSFELQSAANLSDQALQGLLLGTINLAPAIKEVGDEAGITGERLRTHLKSAYDDIRGAQSELEGAMESFGEKVGGDLKTQFEQAGIKGDELRTVLGYIDDNLGTAYQPTMDLENMTSELVTAYMNGGRDAEAFNQKLKDQLAPMQALYQPIVDARVALQDMRGELEILTGKVWAIQIDYGSGPASLPSVTAPSKVFDPITGTFHKDGGGYVVPSGYNENYPVGPGHYASSGEVVTITPKGSSSISNSMTINMQFYGPTSPAAVESAVRRTMKSYGHQYQGG